MVLAKDKLQFWVVKSLKSWILAMIGLFFWSCSSSTQETLFARPVHYKMQRGYWPHLLAGDFNNDKNLDLVHFAFHVPPDTGVHGLETLLGNGSGEFKQSLIKKKNSHFFALAAGDLNRDGNLDLVAGIIQDANFNDSRIGVLLGKGDGDFHDEISYSVGGLPFSLGIDDLNQDQRPDIVAVSVETKEINVFFGNGDGSFAPQLPISFPAKPHPVLFGDFDGDHNKDILVFHYSSSESQDSPPYASLREGSIFWGQGDGFFPFRVPYTWNEFSSLVVDDFNHDLRSDIVTLNYKTGEIHLYLGQKNRIFSETPPFFLDASDVKNDRILFESIVSGDFNMDFKRDLAVASSLGIKIWLGNGDGSFFHGPEIPEPTYRLADWPSRLWEPKVRRRPPEMFGEHLVTGDFNNDGKDDLISTSIPSGEFAVLLNKSANKKQGSR